MTISPNDLVRIEKLQQRSAEIIDWLGRLPERAEGSPEHCKILHEFCDIDETVRKLKHEPIVPWSNI